MASAVLANINEPHWGDPQSYMRNYPQSRKPINSSSHNFSRIASRFNPNPNPDSNPNFPNAARPHFKANNDPASSFALPSPLQPVSSSRNLAVSVSENKDASRKLYVTFDLGSYSRSDLKELKSRLISELDLVRSVLRRIETHATESRPSFNTPLPLQVQIHRHAFDPIVVTRVQPPLKAVKHQNFGSASGGCNTKKSTIKRFPAQKRKTGPSGSGRGRDFKRQAVEFPGQKALEAIMKKCKQMLAKLMNQKSAHWFNKPVDVEALKLHDYYHIIKHPMDLGTIKWKLEKSSYATPLAFADDVRLTFHNALIYNPKGSPVHTLAEKLLLKFEQLFCPAVKKFEADYSSVAAASEHMNTGPDPLTAVKQTAKPISKFPIEPMPTIKSPESLNLQPLQPELEKSNGLQVHMEYPMPVVVSQLPKPKAKDLNKRPMSFQEKESLGAGLQELPPEVAEHMVHIVKKRNPNLMQEGDEIELDIEALDNETLWELERFVNNYKKAVSKMMKQQAENPASAEDLKKAPVIEPIPNGEVQMNKKVDAGEEDVDIGDESPVNNFTPVEIEKDVAGANSGTSCSGASSGSDSSSSSDSGSSSGSDSEEDSVQFPFVEPKETHEVMQQ